MRGAEPFQVVRTASFRIWLAGLKDAAGAAAVARMLDKLGRGLKPDWKAVGGGVQELRIGVGPGYRVYLGQRGRTVVILLCGGDKASQPRDIETARRMWAALQAKAEDGA